MTSGELSGTAAPHPIPCPPNPYSTLRSTSAIFASTGAPDDRAVVALRVAVDSAPSCQDALSTIVHEVA